MNRFLRKAAILARDSKFDGYRVGAVIERGGRIIAEGQNRRSPGGLKSKSHAGFCIHAELDAIISTKVEDLARGHVVRLCFDQGWCAH